MTFMIKDNQSDDTKSMLRVEFGYEDKSTEGRITDEMLGAAKRRLSESPRMKRSTGTR